MYTHDPNYPDVDPITGDEAQTKELDSDYWKSMKEYNQMKRVEACRWKDLMME